MVSTVAIGEIFHGRLVVLMNPKDMHEHASKAGEPLDITSHFQNQVDEELRTAFRGSTL
jgi:hypothetical protein